MVYSSIENKKIKDIKKLSQKKYRDMEGLFLVEGEHLVLEAYKSGLLEELILEENSNFKLDVKTLYVNKKVLSYLSELDNFNGIMGICKKISSDNIGNKVLLLDNIQDPGNLGTIIRSSVAFNFDTIVLSENCVDLYNSKVIRATQGMIFKCNILVKDLKSFIINLKDKDYQVLSTNVNGGKNINNIIKNDRVAIIMGNEGNGVSPEVASLSDELIYIKMNKNCESLNVAVATSIILYELNK